MHPHIRTAAAVALLALTVAACGSSGASPAPSASASPAASLLPSGSPSEAPPAASPAASPTPILSPAATGSPEPTSTPSPALQALLDRLPTKVAGHELAHAGGTLADSATSALQTSFIEFALSLGVDPRDVNLAYAYPAESSQLKANWIYGAFQFTGADPKTLPQKYLDAALASQPDSTATKTTFAGRDVTKLQAAPGATTSAPVYVYFDGDTIFFGGSDDPALAAEIVKSFPG